MPVSGVRPRTQNDLPGAGAMTTELQESLDVELPAVGSSQSRTFVKQKKILWPSKKSSTASHWVMSHGCVSN